MARKQPPEDAVIEAAMRLAATRPWRQVRLQDIAGEAGLTLADLAAVAVDKTDILRLFSRRMDRALLRSLEASPVEGEPQDRLFDVIMRRFELMAPYRKAIASILDSPPEAPVDWVRLADSAFTTQGWILAAAGIDDDGTRRLIKLNGLAWVYGKALRVWAREEDAGMPRTMATLDRSLREGGEWLKRAETPIAFLVALKGLAKGLVKRPRAGGADAAGKGA
jgi:hypothetical protein